MLCRFLYGSNFSLLFRLLLFGAITFWGTALPAQKETRLRFSNLTPAEGLAGAHISCVLQDQEGFIWFGSNYGLQRFDGKSFLAYQNIPGNPHSLSGNLVYWVLEDREGRLWVATSQGLNLFDKSKGSFTRFQHRRDEPSSLPSDRVEYILEDDQGSIWVAMMGGGLARFVSSDSSFLSFSPHPDHPPRNSFSVVLQDPVMPDTLWLSGGGGTYCFRKSTGNFTDLSDKINEVEGVAGFDFDFAGDSLVYISTYGNGVVRIDRRTWEGAAHRFDPYPNLNGTHNLVLNLLPRDEKSYWVSTVDAGFGIYDPDSASFQFIPHDPSWPYSILWSFPTRCLYRDRQGCVWIPMHSGLSRLDEGSQRFERYHLGFESSFMAQDFEAVDFVELGPDIWVATVNGDGLYRVDPATGAYQGFPLPDLREGLPANYLLDLEVIREHELITLTAGGIYRFDTRVLSWERVKLAANLSCLEVFQGELWCGSREGQLFHWDEQRGDWQTWDLPGLGGLVDLSPIPNGGVWMASADQLRYLDPESPDEGIDLDAELAREGFNGITGLEVDSHGWIWLSSRFHGLLLVGPRGKETYRIDSRLGLAHNSIHDFTLLDRGLIYSVSEAGISELNLQTRQIRNFDKEEGFDYRRSTPQIQAGASGWVYAGLYAGFARFHPDSLRPSSQVPKVEFTELRVNDVLQAGAEGLGQVPEMLEVAHDENFLTFDFIALNYASPNKHRYAYKMEGLDRDWIQAGNQTRASYPGMGPGEYRFLVKAANQDGIWNPEASAIKIYIHPPWWETWWFYLAVTLLVIGATGWVFRLRLQQVRRREALKTAFNKKLAEVEMAALRAQMNPHFLFNCLNSINRYIVKHETRKASEYLTDFSSLIRMILKNSSSDMIALSEELKALELYVQMEKLRFDKGFAFRLNQNPEVHADFIRIPPLILQPYVENAIWHGLMHKERSGTLRLDLSMEGEILVCSIEDNGIGRQRAAQLKSKSVRQRKSLGMQITAQRLENLKERYNLEASVKTEDLFTAEGIPAGTRVILRIAT